MDNPKLIFVVDDDPFILTLVEKRLTPMGYTIRKFSYGEDVLKELDAKPQLIILDYLFQDKKKEPVLSGKEILERIQDTLPDVPVIMLSGQEDGDVVLELARMGIEDYVIKDHSFIDNLLEAVEDVFQEES